MKPGTETKLKFKQLKRLLKLPLWKVIGILETLWRVTESNAPAGDIGRLTDNEIAAAFEWDGEAAELINPLIDCRWLDRDDEFRLIVHDWSEHCPNHLKGGFAKSGRLFSDQAAKLRAKQPARQPARQDAKQGAREVATFPILSLPNQTKPPASQPALEGSNGGRAGGDFAKGWGLVADRLGELGASRWREAIADAKQCGCTPGHAMELIAFAKSKGFQVGAIICRLSKARPSLPIADGWPMLEQPEAEKQRQGASRAAKEQQAEQEHAEELRKSALNAAEREKRFGPELDQMPPEELAEMVRPNPAMAKLFRKGSSPLVREWLLIQLEKRTEVSK